MDPDPLDVALEVAGALDACGIDYMIGGSLASSFAGEPRSTMDVDVVASLDARDVGRLVAALGPAFHADERGLLRASREYSSANVIHLATSIKVDIFIPPGTPLDREQMSRRIPVDVPARPGRRLYVSSAEDILLQKLRWYRLGGESRERQWKDVLGIVRVQGDRLDRSYLERGARTMGVADLLQRALSAER